MHSLTLTPCRVLTRHGDVCHNRGSIHVHTRSSIPCHKTLLLFPERSCQESISEWWWQRSVLTPDSSIPPTVEHCNCARLRYLKAHFFCLHQIWWPYTSGNRDGDNSLRIGLETRLSPHTQRLETWLKLKKTRLWLAIRDSWTIFVLTLASLPPSPLLISPSLPFHVCENHGCSRMLQ